MQRPDKQSAVAMALLSVVLLAQTSLTQDWRALAKRYSILAGMFALAEGDGYSFDFSAAESKTVGNLFLLTTIPVRPPVTVAKLDPRFYFATPQPVAALITSVLNPPVPDVVPTEAVLVYARNVGPDSMEFKGEFADSRKEVLYGFFNTKDMTIQMKRNSLMLQKATEQLQEKDGCFNQLYKGEVEKCSETIRVGCALTCWIYAHDRCRRMSRL